MADTPEYQRGAGDAATGTPMPQGEAQALNEAVSALPEQAASTSQAEAGPAPEVQPAQPSDYQPIYQPDTPDDAFLTGPTLKPEEDPATGIPSGAAGVPPEVVRALPMLQRASQDPGADPQLQTLVALVLRELGRG